jgi:parallel beta-helix repeat protein
MPARVKQHGSPHGKLVIAVILVLLVILALVGGVSFFTPGPSPSTYLTAIATQTTTMPFSGPLERTGTLSTNETWAGEIHVTDQVIVPNAITLTIEPGTVVKFSHSRDYKHPDRGALVVSGGTLRAVGTPREPVWFTSDAEDPINGDWEGIAIENSRGANTIRYAIVEYSFIGIRFWTSSGTVSNSIIRWINAEGIYMERSNPVIENNTIYATGYNGIAMEQFNNVIIRNNRIVNNQGSSIHGEATKALIESNFIHNSRTGITFDDYSDAIVQDNLIENVREEALHFYNRCNASVLSNIVRNSGLGIGTFDSALVANHNDIYNNTLNVRIHSMRTVDLRENWWGTAREMEIKAKIESDAAIVVEPFLNAQSLSIKEPVFDYQDIKKTDLGYIPGDPQDKYPYVYANEDETRRVVKKTCGASEGFGEYAFGWSLAWDGRYLWRSRHAGAGDLVAIDPENCRVVKALGDLGIAQDRGIAFDGQHLWVNDFSAKRVFEIDPDSGKVISSFAIPEMGSGSSGIAWDGEYLYLVNWLNQKELYKVDRKGNLIGVMELETEARASITFDGQYFWASPSGLGVSKFDRQGRVVGEIYAAAFGGEAIAYDGQHLWILYRTQELWSDPKLYEIQIINDQVLLHSQGSAYSSLSDRTIGWETDSRLVWSREVGNATVACQPRDALAVWVSWCAHTPVLRVDLYY